MRKDIYCVNEQKVTHHQASVDGNGDFLFVCETCSSFVKFPSGVSKEELAHLIELHETGNTGQVSLEAQQKVLEELLGTDKEDVSEEKE